MVARREIYWINQESKVMMQEKIELLKQHHVTVKVISDFASLAKVYPQNRLNTILIDDAVVGGSDPQLLVKLHSHPEFAGVRFILSISQGAEAVIQQAISLGFRDVIPLNINNELWIKRYAYAASGIASDIAEPYPQITLKNISALHIPMRVAWINEKEIWLESRLTPPVGTRLTLAGGLADYMGVKHVALKVMAHHTTNLHFRYSDALQCQWELPKNQQNR